MTSLKINQDNVIQKNDLEEYYYTRSKCNELIELSLQFKNFYGYKSLILSSGNQAIIIIIKYMLYKYKSKKINFILCEEMYSETILNLKKLNKFYNFDYKIFSIINQNSELTNYANYLLKTSIYDINIIIVDSCTNPDGYCIDFNNLNNFKLLIPNTVIIIDNTWLSYLLCNPFNYLIVDFVVLSLTKYYTGGSIIAGAIIPKYDYNEILDLIKLEGIHISPIICKIILNDIKSIRIRLEKSSYNTIQILNKICNIQNIYISHPYLINKTFDNELYPSVFTITIFNLSKIKLTEKIKENKINLKSSFGSSDTRIEPYFKINDNNSLTLRISIGYLIDLNEDIYKINKLILQLLEN